MFIKRLHPKYSILKSRRISLIFFSAAQTELCVGSYGKISSASTGEASWRDGRAAEGACLENMFGSHQRGFESHSLRLTHSVVTTLVVCKEKRLKSLLQFIGEVPEWLNGLAC